MTHYNHYLLRQQERNKKAISQRDKKAIYIRQQFRYECSGCTEADKIAIVTIKQERNDEMFCIELRIRRELASCSTLAAKRQQRVLHSYSIYGHI